MSQCVSCASLFGFKGKFLDGSWESRFDELCPRTQAGGCEIAFGKSMLSVDNKMSQSGAKAKLKNICLTTNRQTETTTKKNGTKIGLHFFPAVNCV